MRRPPPSPDGMVPRLRHFGGFVLAGLLALATDAVVLELLTRIAGWSPFLARPLSIAVAMVVSWLVNRTVTFAVANPPSFGEFGRFAAVSWFSQAVNYVVFAALLVAAPAVTPLGALVLASGVSMVVSYAGFRFGVFRRSQDGVPE